MVAPEDKGEEETTMDVAERYMGELARRSMIQLELPDEEWGWQISNSCERTCRLHDLMRELCLSKRKKEGFPSRGNMHDSSSSTGGITKTRQLGSCFGLPIDIPDIKEFKLLRVLDFGGFDFGQKSIPGGIGKLIHLKHLSFRDCNIVRNMILPSSIGNLQFLHTLDLRDCGYISIPNILWKLERLRHLYLADSIESIIRNSNKGLTLDGLSSLEILENFYPRLFAVNDLFKLPELRNFGAFICERLKDDLEPIINYLNGTSHQLRQSFLHITRRHYDHTEEELSLVRKVFGCRSLKGLMLVGPIRKLPEYHHGHFSISLTRIALWGSKLEEDPMTTLEKLPNLQSLLLCDSAYVGKEMVCSAGGFPQLISLGLRNLADLENWRVDEGTLPTLCSLRIERCQKMETVPKGLRFLTSIRELRIEHMSDAFRNKVRVVDGVEGEDSYIIRHVPSVTII